MSQPGKSEVVLPTDGQNGNEGQQPAQGGNEGQQQGQYGGFNTVEELVAAHEALKGQQAPNPDGKSGDEAKPNDLTIKDGEEGGDAEVGDVLARAGLKQEEFTQEFAANGKLSEDSYAKLEKAGFPKAMVDVYVSGLKAEQAAYSAAVYGPAGGEAKYAGLVKWAGKNATPAEKQAFNDAVTSGDPTKAGMAVTAMVAKMSGKGGLLNGKTGGNESGVQPFRSNAELTTAMRDPRYRRDEAYRKDVAERLRVSGPLR